MRVARADVAGDLVYGIVSDSQQLELLVGAPYGGQVERTGRSVAAGEFRLLAPVTPSKIVAVGRNYADHAGELGLDLPKQPRIFLKPPTTVIGPEEHVEVPAMSDQVEYEAELAVVIGERCRLVDPADAERVIFGYTCANDVTARDIQQADGQPTFAKSFDTFCPLGPWVETDLDPGAVEVSCRVNGQLRQQGNSADMIWSVSELLSYISSAMTLLPGDVVLTGTPAGVGQVGPGDLMSVHVQGIGDLRNPVRAGAY